MLLCFVDAPVTGAINGNPLFPCPDALKPNVDFWIKVYGVYSQDQVIIHDAERLDIIYEVVSFDSLFRGVNVSDRIKWKKIARISKSYAKILRKLARKRKLKIDQLTGKERAVALLFKDDLSPRTLRAAAKRIREQSGIKEEFRLGLQRSGLYISRIRELFRREGLPLELAALPHVESSFNYKAYSKFGAAGIWQFMRSTGRAFMKINYAVDERFDPIRASESAAKLLKKNYQALGSWPLAITAYNHGRAGMKRAKKRYGENIADIIRRYKSRSFGFASRNFYAQFLAAVHVSKNYRQYFGDIEFYRPKDYVVFETPDYISVKALLSKLNVDLKTFAEFNPALRKPVLQSRRRIPKDFRIRIPYRDGVDIAALYAEIASQHKYDKQVMPEWHKVRRGESLSQIARRYHISVSDLMAQNDIRNAHRIYVGQNLQIPSRDKSRRKQRSRISKAGGAVQLAEAPDLTRREKSVLDVPVTMTAEDRTVPAERSVSAPAVTSAPVEYVPVKSSGRASQTKLPTAKPMNAVPVREIEQKYESVDNVMAMALPDYYVEMTKDMGLRVVRKPRVETTHEAFRGIAFPQNGQVRVEPDETLGHFADWLHVPTWKLRRINGFSFRQAIRVGQLIWLTFESVTPEEFHRRRTEYHQGIEEDFYRNFTITGQKMHKVRRGENIWYLCNRVYEIPYWLLEKYNSDRDLLKLVAGEEIVIPVVEAALPAD